MSASLLSHFLPLRINTVLFGVYDYLVPIMLYCAWSTLALLDLARAEPADRSRGVRWALVIIALPVIGAAAYLLAGKSGLARRTRITVVAGGLLIVGAAFGFTYIRIS